jgi:pimeloyl-ACP methyl ester carboxylesterase
LKECLQNIDANPALYTTSIAMDDLDQVRAGLGYDRVNLYGISYGTRAALTYMKQYPQRVRSAILDGVVPQDEILGLNVALDAQRSLDLIFERCAADENCRKAYPDLRSDFSGLLQSLEEAPVEVTLDHPVTGERTELSFSAEKLAGAVRLLSYAPETAALLPLLIHTAHVEKDLSLLAAQYLIVSDQLIDSISEGMNYSVICAEDVPFYSAEEARQAYSGTYLESVDTGMMFKICQTWPNERVSAGFKEAVRAENPVLILSGEADPVTPPENGERVAQTLPNSLHLVAPGQGHNVIFRGCLPRVASNFIEQGTVQGLDTACVSEIQPLPFFLNFSGPTP